MRCTRPALSRLAPIALACMSLGSPGMSSAVAVSWVGANGSFWDLAGNWAPGLPGLADDAGLGAFDTVFRSGVVGVKTFAGTGKLTLTGGDLRATAASSIGTLAISGSSLGGVGTVTAATLSFTSGAKGQNGQRGGITNVNGAATFDGSTSPQIYYGRQLNLNGGATWAAGTGIIYIYSGDQGNSAMNIAAGTTFADAGTAAASQVRRLGYYGDGTVNNAGTYVRTGLGTTQVNSRLVNSGTLQANAGTLSLAGGGSSSGTLSGGAMRVLGNVANAASSLTMTGGTLSGPGTVTVGALNFTGGTMGETGWGGGTTVVTGQTNFDGTAGQYICYGRALQLNGDATWSAGAGAIYISSGDQGSARLNIASAKTFTDAGTTTSNQTRYLGYYADGTVNNAGTYARNGLGTTQVNAVFNNSGTVAVNSGTMTFVNNAIQGTGTLQIGAGGSVKLLSSDSTVGRLVHNGVAGSLDIGANQIVVSKDYTNANWGSGNSFNRLANLTFTGTGEHIVAAGNVAQAVGGALVTSGTTDVPTLTIGNVHVGGYAVAYDIQNTGTSGPSLRGAVQSNINGASITDARLSGVAKNWGRARWRCRDQDVGVGQERCRHGGGVQRRAAWHHQRQLGNFRQHGLAGRGARRCVQHHLHGGAEHRHRRPVQQHRHDELQQPQPCHGRPGLGFGRGQPEGAGQQLRGGGILEDRRQRCLLGLGHQLHARLRQPGIGRDRADGQHGGAQCGHRPVRPAGWFVHHHRHRGR